MNFTYNAYKDLLLLLDKKGYYFVNYQGWEKYDKTVILRHDVDYSVEKAIKLAELEASIGVRSTYFVLLTSDFYNVFSEFTRRGLKNIKEMGHDIGLHFDETCYGSNINLVHQIENELEVLSNVLDEKILAVSMHRPSNKTLKADYSISNGAVANSYGYQFFRNFKYLSDSRRCWRENVKNIVELEEYSRLHILTHAFWYHEEERSLEESIEDFICGGSLERYEKMNKNFTDLKSVMLRNKVIQRK